MVLADKPEGGIVGDIAEDVVGDIPYLENVVGGDNEETPFQNDELDDCHSKAMGADDSLIHLLLLVGPFHVLGHY